MRVISQDGKYNLNFDSINIVCSDVIEEEFIIEAMTMESNSRFIQLAKYSTREQMLKAMDSLNNNYENVMTVKCNGVTKSLWDYPKVFRFPSDEQLVKER